MKLPPRLKREMVEVGLVSLYFFCCFSVFMILKKLILADYHVEVQALPTAAIGALIAAKVAIVLDKTHAGTRLEANHSLLAAALYKATVYIFATFFLLVSEKVFEHYKANGGVLPAIADIWEHRDRNIMLAKLLCVSLTFFAYHIFAGIDRQIGEGKLRRMLLWHPDRLKTSQ
ncbi:hypothetical protein [Methylomonas sp. MgM2]